MLVLTSLEGRKGHLEDEGITGQQTEEQIEDNKDECNFHNFSSLSLAGAHISRFPLPAPHPHSRLFSPDSLRRERQLPIKRNINDFIPSNKSCGVLRRDSLAPFQD